MKKDPSLESLQDRVPNTKNSTVNRAMANSSPDTVVVLTDVNSDKDNRFFVIDWLEQLNDEELKEARQIIESNNLVTPKKHAAGRNKQQQAPSPATPPCHPHSRRAAPMTPSSFRAKSEAIGTGWNAKGLEKAKQEKWEEALLCWNKALEIRVQVLGESHPDTANTLNNMGIALGRLNRYEEAMRHLERALKVRTLSYGDCHMEIAATLHNIANVFSSMNDYPNALRCLEETKRIHSKLLGPNHVQVARTSAAIGHLHFEKKAYERALESYKEARAIFRRNRVRTGELQQTEQDIKEVQELIKEDYMSE